jgi:hypothetical protein
MIVININTKEVIEELGDWAGIYWTTPEYWTEYKAFCRELEKKEMRWLYGKY